MTIAFTPARAPVRHGPSAHRLSLITRALFLAAGTGCSPGAGGSVAAAAAAGAEGPDALCEPENTTQACTCGPSAGSQTCIDGAWTSCSCSVAVSQVTPGGTGGAPPASGAPQTFAGNLRSDITFDWESTAPPGDDGSCPAGQYEGNLEGIYWSILDPTHIGLPITNLEPPGSPSGFHFTVEPAQGGETVQKVKGEVNGLADLLFPFKAQIDGELNCRTATFTARLHDGSYSVLIDGLIPQKFEGVATAKYDKRTQTFVEGIWDVMETTATPPGTLAPQMPREFTRDGFGGAGKFAAALPTDPNNPNLTVCPANFTCGPHLLGPNKHLCNTVFGTPTCATDADCATLFPGENVPCLNASLFSLCVRECKQ